MWLAAACVIPCRLAVPSEFAGFRPRGTWTSTFDLDFDLDQVAAGLSEQVIHLSREAPGTRRPRRRTTLGYHWPLSPI